MFGSDWPVAELGGYAKVTTEIATLLDRLSLAERDAVLGGMATRFYTLCDPVAGPGDNSLPSHIYQEATMPLFSNQQQDQGAAVWEPRAAEGRLGQTAGANPAGVFTSDLSVSEYVLPGGG